MRWQNPSRNPKERMNNTTKKIIAITVCALWFGASLFGVFHKWDENEVDHKTMTTVLGKLQRTHGKSASDLILILRDVKGRTFSLEVAPQTFLLSKEGDVLVFNISEADITGNHSIAWIGMLCCISAIAAFVFFFVFLFISADELFEGE